MTEEKFQGYVELVKFNVEQFQSILEKSKKTNNLPPVIMHENQWGAPFFEK